MGSVSDTIILYGSTALSDDFLVALAKKGAAKGRYQGKHLKLLRKMQT